MSSTSDAATGPGELQRTIDWRGAFWVASGVPALVLFSIGGIAGTTGKLAFLVWAISIVMGFIQSFTYAEISGMFPNKSGGASVYGATAWLRYSKLVAPLSVWCNWFAWSPVLSLGCAIAASYILNAIAPIPAADSAVVTDWVANPANAQAIAGLDPAGAAAAAVAALTPSLRTWSAGSLPIEGFATVNINATFVIGAILMLIVFMIQHRGILRTAGTQKYIGGLILAVMLIVGVWPIVTGQINWANFSNLVPPATAYSADPGTWNNSGWALFLGGLFIAAWSTYAFETAVCYTREFKNPATDTFKAIFYSGLVCVLIFFLVPFSFQGVLGVEGMLATPIVDGSGIGEAMARMVAGNNGFLINIFVALMVLALLLAIMTAMAGSSRTLYQGSVDGWLPRYLSYVNSHGAPTRAMWTDLVFNLLLLSIASDPAGYFSVLAVSNVGYIIFNFLNLNAGWIHRIDSGHIERPYRAPTFLLALGTILAFVNAFIMGAGAKVWGYSFALWVGFVFAALIIPVFAFRHYIQDGGQFPKDALEDLGIKGGDLGERKAGMLPYLTLLAGIVVVLLADHFVGENGVLRQLWYFIS